MQHTLLIDDKDKTYIVGVQHAASPPPRGEIPRNQIQTIALIRNYTISATAIILRIYRHLNTVMANADTTLMRFLDGSPDSI